MSARTLVGIAAALAAGAQTPTFDARVSLVTVDAVVLGADGEPVGGLPPEAFEVLEDGVAQPLASFTAIGPAPAAAPSAAAPEPAPARVFALVFDDRHLSKPQAERVKAAIAAFLERQTGTGDVVALFAPGNQVSRVTRLPEGRAALLALVSRLKGLARRDGSMPRVSEQEALAVERYRDQRVEEALVARLRAYDPQPKEREDSEAMRLLVRAKAAEVYAEASAATAETLTVLERTLAWLSELPGRRTLVLASAGFVYEDGEPRLRTLAQASLRANAPLHFIDARGLDSPNPFKDVEYAVGTDTRQSATSLEERLTATGGADVLALDSGGIVIRNQNNLATGLGRIAAAARTYYLLGYVPPVGKKEGRFRKIEVRVNVPGARVRARRGYYGG